MDTINPIIVMHKSALETRAPLTQQGEPWWSALELQGGLADKCDKGIVRCCEYHDDTHPPTTIIVKGAPITTTKVQHTQPRTRRSSKRETSGRLGIFMPQISCDENVKMSNKTHNEELAKNNKNTATWHLGHASCAGHLLDKQRWQLTETVLSSNKTSASSTDNNGDKNYHLHFGEKLKAGCVVVVPFSSLTINS